MAQKTGYAVSMDNSDDNARKFDISCTVVAGMDGKVDRVDNINVARDGDNVGNGYFNGLSGVSPNLSLNLSGLQPEEVDACVAALTAFIRQAADEAGQECAAAMELQND